MPETEMLIITIPYRGADSISINHKNKGGSPRFALTPEAKSTQDEIIWKVKNSLQFMAWKPKAPLTVILSGQFRNRREAPDLHNCIKLICDSIEDGIRAICPPGVNDKDFTVICFKNEYGTDSPAIRIEVKQE